MIFTHFGVSGPIILLLSTAAAHKGKAEFPMELVINLKPALSEEKMLARLQRDFEKYERKQMENAMQDLLPRRLIPVVLAQAGVAADLQASRLPAAARRQIAYALQNLQLTVTGTRPIEEAVVTAGGVSVKKFHRRPWSRSLCLVYTLPAKSWILTPLRADTIYRPLFLRAMWPGRRRLYKRANEMKKISVAIDGPAGAGKSSVAKLAAKRVGYLYIDTGAMYRAITWQMLRKKTDIQDEGAVRRLLDTTDVVLKTGDADRVFVNAADVTDAIREPG